MASTSDVIVWSDGSEPCKQLAARTVPVEVQDDGAAEPIETELVVREGEEHVEGGLQVK